MQLRALFWWDRLRTSFWLVPALMAAGALLLSLATVALDHRLESGDWSGTWWLYGGGPEGARSVLSVLASSMITVVGVVFSIMMVVLSLAAQQYGPRLLRNFMRDTITQCVLGVFVATFFYCLMVLRTIRSEAQQEFVPQISVTIGIAFSLISLSVLIYFIHHVSVSIHIGEIISRVQGELLSAIDSIFPESLGKDEREVDVGSDQQHLPANFEQDAAPLLADRAGYVEAIEDTELLDAAGQHDLLIRLQVQPGDFLLPEQCVASVWPAHHLSDDVRKLLRKAIILGDQRTSVQDIRYALGQQADVAIRALSPGINDPLTAIACLEHLGEALCRIEGRRMPSPLRYDDQGVLRVVASPVAFERMIDASIGIVREYAGQSPTVTAKILEVLFRLAKRARRREHRQALLEQLDAIAENKFENCCPRDVAQLRDLEQRVHKQLGNEAVFADRCSRENGR
jgi:uncharacterized membrane protein